MQYKYIIVCHSGSAHIFKTYDLTNHTRPMFLQDLLDQGWIPIRETKFGGGGDTNHMALLILLGREKLNASN